MLQASLLALPLLLSQSPKNLCNVSDFREFAQESLG